MAEGLNFLHTIYTIHGDLKGVSSLFRSPRATLPTLGQPNILVSHDGHACLADFGLASIIHGNNSTATDLGGYFTRWTAPEILQGAQNITWLADVFSFGMVVLEVSPRSYLGRKEDVLFSDTSVLF